MVIPLSLGWLRGLLYLVGSLTWGALACVWVGWCLGWVVSGVQSILGGWCLAGSWCWGWCVWVLVLLSWGAGWWGCIFFAVWGVVGCVFAGGGIVRVGGVFGDTVVGWFLRGVVTPHPRVARMVFSVVQYLYEVERNAPTKPPPDERENVMAISATLEARSTTILNNLDILATAAKKGARKVAKKPASQGPLNLADRMHIRVFQKQEKLAKATRRRYAGQLEEFRINHDEEGFTVTLEKATGEYDKMHKVFKNFNSRR